MVISNLLFAAGMVEFLMAVVIGLSDANLARATFIMTTACATFLIALLMGRK